MSSGTVLLDGFIDAWSARTPAAEAFRFGDRSLSYGELARQSDGLAGWLYAKGVRRGDRVGILQTRCIEMPVAVFGVMKAGAAYVPLDPGAPPARLAQCAADCELGVIIANEPTQHLLPEIAGNAPSIRTILGLSEKVCTTLDTVSFETVQGLDPGPVPDQKRDADDPSYIIFTSGSTGVPKGVVHTHASAVAYAEMSADLYDLRASDRMGNQSPLHFDMSTFEFFSGPSRGACTVLIPEAFTKLPASLTQLMEDERLTTLYTVPFALIQILEAGVPSQRDLSALRWVVHAGEPMSPRHLSALQRLLPDARFSNSYGPAEVNQITYFNHPPEPIADDALIPLGYPCAHTKLRIDDAGDGKGELLAATPAMMLGYWNDPDLDDTCFVDAPDEDGRMTRYYRTGDLVWQDGEGLLHFSGRIDRQIKVRGVRVELDEVELALEAHSSVSEAAVIPSADGNTLVSFVTLQPGADATSDELLHHSAQLLSSHSLPRELTILDGFPRTGTNKIDRNALKRRVGA